MVERSAYLFLRPEKGSLFAHVVAMPAASRRVACLLLRKCRPKWLPRDVVPFRRRTVVRQHIPVR